MSKDSHKMKGEGLERAQMSYIDRRGNGAEADATARFAAEARRMAGVINGAAIPDGCGPDIAPAPARGAFVAAHQAAMVPNGVDDFGLTKWVCARTGYGHRASVRAADVFDRILASAMRRKRPCPLTPGQIAMGRRYAALVELAAADGTKVSRLDASRAGGDSMGWMDRHLGIAQELEILRRRIGPGAALAVRRIRPSARGETQRGPIMDRVLVDMVCIKGCALDDVLASHGWAIKGDHRKAVTAALSAALDRMIGYRG